MTIQLVPIYPIPNHPTHASTQHRKLKPINGPTYGTLPSANETTTDVNTITTRYADVASMVNIPVYVTGCWYTARLPR